MPLDPTLDANYAGQNVTIDAALTTANTVLMQVIGKPLNLSDEERQNTPSIGEHRHKFVDEAISFLGDQHPNMMGPAITLQQAKHNWEFVQVSEPLIIKAQAFLDALIDANVNARNICLNFTEDMRKKSKRFKDRNVQGADIVWDHLKDLHKVGKSKEPDPEPGE